MIKIDKTICDILSANTYLRWTRNIRNSRDIIS